MRHWHKTAMSSMLGLVLEVAECALKSHAVSGMLVVMAHECCGGLCFVECKDASR